MDMAFGRIAVWHVEEGAKVEKGAPLFDIETDKAAMEIEAEADGYLHHRAPEGAEIAIGAPAAWLYVEGEDPGDAPPPSAPGRDARDSSSDLPPAPSPPTANRARTAADQTATAPASCGVRATPRARALAREAGIDIAEVSGSGPRGRVQGDDVRALREAPSVSLSRPPARFAPETGSLSVIRSETGEGAPVVMFHGFASDARSWALVEEHLERRPLVRIELPSHGRSPRLAIDGFGTLAAEVRRCFDDLSLEQAHLVGHSLGGALALALADTRRNKVASLTLIAPAGLGPEIDGVSLRGICAASRVESLAPWLRSLVADEALITDGYARAVMAGRSDPQLRAAQSALADALFPDGVQAFDLRAALARVDTPARILWGKSDGVIPWRHALRAPGRVALHLFEGVGHVPQIEVPDAVGSLLAAVP